MPIYKGFHAKVGYSKMPHADYSVFVASIIDGMDNNPNFPKPPVDLAKMKTLYMQYKAAVSVALDGGKMILSQRNGLREELDARVRMLAHYVTAASNDEEAIFRTSGFEPLTNTRIAPQQPDTPRILKIQHGANSGTARVSLSPSHRKFIHCTLQFSETDAAGSPISWTEKIITRFKGPIPIENLKPATTYLFRVRALGALGYTDWSNPIHFIVT